jgi:phosphoribosyl 1,2-cyclic phosphodiesterase
MLPETLDFILRRLPATDVLVLDALLADERTNPSHYNLPQAVELARKIRPAQTLLVGINCDSFLPHDEMNVKLRKEYTDLNIQLAHDGLVIKAS